MKVSIVVTLYNKEEYLKQCVDSLISQTHEDIEILLIDDGSTDSSAQICDEYADNYPTVKVLHKQNGGLVSSWRAGTELASGDYISYVDSDDWIDSDMMEKLVFHATGRDDEIIMSDYIIERDNGSSNCVWQNIEAGEYIGERIVKDIFPRLFGLEERAICRSRCMKLFSAKLAKENAHYGDLRLRFGEDTSLSLPCVLGAGRIYILDHEAMYHYRYVNDSMVHNYDRTLVPSIELVQEITEQAIRDYFEQDSSRLDGITTTKQLLELSKKEYVFLLMYAVKNELRGEKDSYVAKIRAICLDEKNRKCIMDNPVSVRNKANRLIYSIMKKPSYIRCSAGRVAMIIKSKS